MELIVVLGGFIALAVVALRLGHDTRERLISQEERFAHLGFTWGPAGHATVGPLLTLRRWMRDRQVCAASGTRPASPPVLSRTWR